MGILQVITEEQLQAAEKKEAENNTPSLPIIDSLASYVDSEWRKAKQAKDPITHELLKSLRQYKSEYEPEKLAAIKQLKGSESFLPITNIKCRAGESWLRDVLSAPSGELFSVEPTPMPELPEDIQNDIKQRLMTEYQRVAQQSLMIQARTGMPPDSNFIKSELLKLKEEFERIYQKELEDKAKKEAEEAKRIINDQFTEGGFYKALDEAIHDITIYKTAVIKGPEYKKVKQYKKILSPNTGEYESVVTEVVKETYKRVSPFNIYPAADSTGINDGGLIEMETLNPKDLYDLIGLEGFNELEVRKVINKYENSGLRDWSLSVTERKEQENKYYIQGSDKIDVLIYWGFVKGSYLLEWGMKPEEIPDDGKFYSVCVWKIESHVIKAMLNYDPLGNKPYSKASFIEIPDSWWGMSLPNVLEDIQAAANAASRAIINNMGICSLPIVERNMDRIPPYESKVMYPGKILDSTDEQIIGSPAYRFYQPNMVSDRIIQVLQQYLRMADELSGIPAYSHGDVTVGGAGRTAAGLSMLTSNSSRGIKSVIRNIDKGLIESMVERQYNINLKLNIFKGNTPDCKVVAKGFHALQEKEVQSMRKTDFLRDTLNPIDLQIIGLLGRKALLEETAKAVGIDIDKVFQGQPPMQDASVPSQGAPPRKSSGNEQGNIIPNMNEYRGENGR